MTVSDLVQIGESFHNLSSQNVQFITVPNEPWPQNANRVQFVQPQADQVFAAIARDMTVPKVSTTPAPSVLGRRAGAHHQPGQRQGRGPERLRASRTSPARRPPG